MTRHEKYALIAISERIKELSSLENASFSSDTAIDRETKERIAPYMSWFRLCSLYIDDVLRVTDEKDRDIKEKTLVDITKYC